MPKRPPNSIRYELAPGAEAAEAIMETVRAYGRMMEILDGVDAARDGRANLAAIHDAAYQRVRDETGLPSRLVKLGMTDHSRLVPGEPVTSLPLDDKLFALKGPDTVSLSTVSGRHLIAYRVVGYGSGWTDFAPARLHVGPDGMEIRIGVDVGVASQENDMIQEGILGRVGRVLAGAAHAAIDGIEARNPVATVEQAIRQIDEAIDAAKSELGAYQAKAHQVDSRIKEVRREIAGLDERIRLALSEGREDLARAAAARQIDFETQLDALAKAADEISAGIDEGSRGLAAARAARREAEDRLAALTKPARQGAGPAGTGGAGRPARPDIEGPMRAIQRVTGVPGAPETGATEMEELDAIARRRQVDERLARFRGGTER